MGIFKLLNKAISNNLRQEIILNEKTTIKWEVVDEYKATTSPGQVLEKKILMTIFSARDNNFLKVYNAFGTLLDGESVSGKPYLTSSSDENLCYEVKGLKSGITVKDYANYNSIINKLMNKKLNFKGRIIDFKSFNINKKKIDNFLNFILGTNPRPLFSDRPKKYSMGISLNKLVNGKLLLKTKDNEYFAVEYFSESDISFELNTEIEIVEGVLFEDEKIILANKIKYQENLIKEPKFFLFNKNFDSLREVNGKVIRAEILYTSDIKYFEKLLGKSRLFNKDETVELLRDTIYEAQYEQTSRKLQMPYYLLEIDLGTKKSKIFYFRPVFLIYDDLLFPVSWPVYVRGNELQIKYQELGEDLNVCYSILNKSFNTFNFSTLDFDYNEIPDDPGNKSKQINLRGRIVYLNPIKLIFGVDEDRLNIIFDSFFDTIYNYLVQVIFLLQCENTKRIYSCSSSFRLFEVGGNFITANTIKPIPQSFNINVEVNGFLDVTGILNVREMKVVGK